MFMLQLQCINLVSTVQVSSVRWAQLQLEVSVSCLGHRVMLMRQSDLLANGQCLISDI